MLVGYMLLPDRAFSPNENRYLTQMPVLTADGLFSGRYTEEMEDYLDDQIPGREQWIETQAQLQRAAGDTEINGVYLAEDGYLIGRWLEQDLDQTRLDQNIAAVETFARANPTLQVTAMIVPTAGLILKDKLPDGAPMLDQSQVLDTIAEELQTASFLDLRPTLEAAAAEPIYYKTDHHWTTLGAWYAYAAWREAKGETADRSAYTVQTVSDQFRGTMYSRVLLPDTPCDTIAIWQQKAEPDYTVQIQFGAQETDSVYDWSKLEEKDQYQVFLGGNPPELTIKTDVKNGKHLLVLKDSYANAWIPFLLCDYEQISVVDLRYFNGDLSTYLAEQEITEAVILYNVQSFAEDTGLGKLQNLFERESFS